MAYLARKPRKRDDRIGPVEVICILVVLAAIAGLVAFIIVNAGGGHLLT